MTHSPVNKTASLRGLYGITDDALLPGELLLPAVAAALAGGLSLLQYRSKSGPAGQRLALAQSLVALCAKHDVPLLINDDIDLALNSKAQGVHLGQQDDSIASARKLLGPDAIIGVTCHSSLELAIEAEKLGADYVAFGRFFPSRSKPHAPAADLEILTLARENLSIPVVAIGGINAENSAAVLTAGAQMVAAIEAVFGNAQSCEQVRVDCENFVDAIERCQNR